MSGTTQHEAIRPSVSHAAQATQATPHWRRIVAPPEDLVQMEPAAADGSMLMAGTTTGRSYLMQTAADGRVKLFRQLMP